MKDKKRILFLVTGVFTMLFAGFIYAWSVIKEPFSKELGWQGSCLTINFTITMCCFCLGGLAGGQIFRKKGTLPAMIIGSVLAASGLLLTSSLSSGSILRLYLYYGIMTGLGVGISYVTVVSTVTSWFCDMKGFCSGCLMLGFGLSTMILGNISRSLFDSIGWRYTYASFGIVIGIVFLAAGIILKKQEDDDFDQSNCIKEENGRDMETGEMIRRSSFWRAFFCIVFLAALGNTIISFARDFAVYSGATEKTATFLVGILAFFNGLGRIVSGIMFDHFGRLKSMVTANITAITAASMLLVSCFIHSLALSIMGMCLTGLSYGACPTFTSAITSELYGNRYFSSNFSVMNFNLMGASIIATVSGFLLSDSNNYSLPILLLLLLSMISLILSLSIRKS